MQEPKFELRAKTFRGLESYLSRRPRGRLAVFVCSVFAVAAGAIVYAFRSALVPQFGFTALTLAVFFGAGGLGALSIALNAYQSANRAELDQLRGQREKLQDKISSKEQADIFDVIQLSLSQVTEYYTINKSQARKSFDFSVFAVFVGLTTIIGGIWLIYSRNPSSSKASVGTISAVSGLLLQFLGGANFYIYNKSLVQMNYFYDRLMQMQDTMLSIKVGEQIQNAEARDRVKERIVSGLLTSAQPKTHFVQAERGAPRKNTDIQAKTQRRRTAAAGNAGDSNS